MSERAMLTPELRKASSRSRCSSVAKSYSMFLKVSVEAWHVTSVPRLPGASATSLSGATARPLARRARVAWGEFNVVFLVAAPGSQAELARQRVDSVSRDAVQAPG